MVEDGGPKIEGRRLMVEDGGPKIELWVENAAKSRKTDAGPSGPVSVYMSAPVAGDVLQGTKPGVQVAVE
ncbi:MAG: hypothetical protein A3K90_04010 [Pelodictyon luteolum]|uniref:Uncharacterized protein n=1 Tax=Pelodictyon luteolum TaxID=1100 RepID=A0A165LTS7_PELLU|nr:MAG: hypothetical protein A3K90_04010 [Pelodictyon luteolum]